MKRRYYYLISGGSTDFHWKTGSTELNSAVPPHLTSRGHQIMPIRTDHQWNWIKSTQFFLPGSNSFNSAELCFDEEPAKEPGSNEWRMRHRVWLYRGWLAANAEWSPFHEAAINCAAHHLFSNPLMGVILRLLEMIRNLHSSFHVYVVLRVKYLLKSALLRGLHLSTLLASRRTRRRSEKEAIIISWWVYYAFKLQQV